MKMTHFETSAVHKFCIVGRNQTKLSENDDIYKMYWLN